MSGLSPMMEQPSRLSSIGTTFARVAVAPATPMTAALPIPAVSDVRRKTLAPDSRQRLRMVGSAQPMTIDRRRGDRWKQERPGGEERPERAERPGLIVPTKLDRLIAKYNFHA